MSMHAFCVSNKIFSFSLLLSKYLTFSSPTITTITFCNFNDFLCFRFFLFTFTQIISNTILKTSNTPCLCHLIPKNHNLEVQSVDNQCFFCRFEKVKFEFYVYIHIILAKRIFNFVICSVEIESLLITSPKISSTLKLVELKNSFPLSK